MIDGLLIMDSDHNFLVQSQTSYPWTNQELMINSGVSAESRTPDYGTTTHRYNCLTTDTPESTIVLELGFGPRYSPSEGDVTTD